LWSYPNVYTDEGRHGCGDGKELCDLLIVFGNDIILFSDKYCEFQTHDDINIAWSRWYRRAIDKSVKQLKGAESWINRFPEKVFLDKNCETPLPVKLPSTAESRIHLIAVTGGSGKHAESFWGGGSSGSLYIDTKLVAEQHKEKPFSIGWPLQNKRFVHVLDETTLDVVLNELDTISDFVEYLRKKEELFYTQGVDCIIPGEEELIAFYLSNFDHKKNEYYFPDIPQGALLVLREGDWQRLIDSPEYAARYEANAISYIWDDLIEFHSQHIIHGSAISLDDEKPNINHERLMRIIASENRLRRRALGEAFHLANNNEQKGMRFTRTILSPVKEGRAYIFMSLSKSKDFSVDEYLDMRRSELMLYIEGCKLKFENISEAIGIVFEPGQKKLNTIDFLFIDFGAEQLDKEFANDIRIQLKNANMWDTQTLKFGVFRDVPFPKTETPLIDIKLWLGRKLNQSTQYIKQLFNKN